MKTLTIVFLMLIFLTCFSFCYYHVLDQTNFGVISYDDYVDNPPCEFKKLEDGWTQLSNCAVYRVKSNG